MKTVLAAGLLVVILVVGAPFARGKSPVEAENLPAPGTSARKLAASLTDGNDHRIRNNAIVKQLVAKGQRAILPLTQCLDDPEFEGRGYAAWALAEVVRETKADPRTVIPRLRLAAKSDDGYVRALATSALRRLGASASRSAQPKVFKPNPHILSALKDAPGPDAPIEELVTRMGEREGHWREIVLDRILSRGDEGAKLLQTAALDVAYPARAYAAWGLGRLHRSRGRSPQSVVDLLRELGKAKSEEVRRFASAGLAILASETPLGREDGLSFPPERLAAALHPGNRSVTANNILVDQLLLHGEKALPALLTAAKDPAFRNRFYTDWAIAKILRVTGSRPAEILEHLKARYRPGSSPISILGM